jgi:MFS family permease
MAGNFPIIWFCRCGIRPFINGFIKRKSRKIEDGSIELSENQIVNNLKSLFGNTAFILLLLYFTIPSLSGWGIKNWLPTLFSQSLHIDMAQAGPLSTITMAFSSLVGVLAGGYLSDRWIQTHIRGRIFVSTIGLGLTIPALFLLGFGTEVWHLVGAAICFGLGYGMFDANNMPILCQIVSEKQRGAPTDL